MNRRGFLQGLVAVAALATAPARVAVKVYQATKGYFLGADMFNYRIFRSWAWDPRHTTYNAAKEASDKIAEEVLKRGFK